MDFTPILKYLRVAGHWLADEIYWPMLTRTALYLSQKARLKPDETPPPAKTEDMSEEVAWKQKAVSDFDAWLAELPDEMPPSDTADMESCDLFTLLTQFIALRQEIKLQNREQHEAIRMQKVLIDGHKEIADLFEHKTRQLEQLEENIRRACEKRTALPFFDIRDALCRGLASAHAVAAKKGIFR